MFAPPLGRPPLLPTPRPLLLGSAWKGPPPPPRRDFGVLACLLHSSDPLVPHLPAAGLGINLHHAGAQGGRRRSVLRGCKAAGHTVAFAAAGPALKTRTHDACLRSELRQQQEQPQRMHPRHRVCRRRSPELLQPAVGKQGSRLRLGAQAGRTKAAWPLAEGSSRNSGQGFRMCGHSGGAAADRRRRAQQTWKHELRSRPSWQRRQHWTWCGPPAWRPPWPPSLSGLQSKARGAFTRSQHS